MQNHFPGSTYETPPDRPRYLLDRLLLGSRYGFHAHSIVAYCRAGMTAAAGQLDDAAFTAIAYNYMRIAEGCGARIHIVGLDHIDEAEGAVLFVGNHMSMLETAVMNAFIVPRKPVSYVVKKALFKIPFYKRIMEALEAVPVGRSDPRDDLRAVMVGGKRLLAAGRSIVLFPQSTRMIRFDPREFNTIGVKLARAAEVPIIPFALKTDFLTPGRLLRDLGPIHRDRTVHFEFAPALRVEGNGQAEHRQIVAFIQDRLRKWGAE